MDNPKTTKNKYKLSKADALMQKIQNHNSELTKLWNQWKELVWGKGAI